MKKCLFLLFYLAVTTCFGQGRLVPFEDYSLCKTGFKYGWGDTLFPAKFEHVKELPYHLYRHPYKSWILSENDAFGILRDNGTWIIPCKYQSIELLGRGNKFIAMLNGKRGIIDDTDSMLLPFEYDAIIPEFYSYPNLSEYVVNKKGLYGVLDTSYQVVIPLAYNTIQKKFGFSSAFGEVAKEFYEITKNGNHGLISRDNKVIIPPSYEIIKPMRPLTEIYNDWLFRANDSLRQETVFDQNGRQLVPLHSGGYDFLDPRLRNIKTASKFLVADNDEGQTCFYDIASGKASGWWDEIILLGDWIYVSQHEQWSIMDLEFNFLHRDLSEQLFYFFEGVHPEPLQSTRSENIYPYSEKYSGLPPVYLLKQKITYDNMKKKDAYEQPQYSNYALWNIETGKCTPYLYSPVFRFSSPEGAFYWTFDEKELNVEEHEMTIGIFDENGMFRRQLCLPASSLYALEQFLSSYQHLPYVFISNDSGKFNVVSKSGILSSELQFDELPDKQAPYNPLILRKNKLFGVYDTQLNEVIPPVYDTIERLQLNLLLLKQGNLLAFTDTNGIILLDSCETLSTFSGIPSEQFRNDYMRFAVKDSTVYCASGDRFAVYDSTFIQNIHGTQIGPLSINHRGKIIAKKSTVQRQKIGSLYYILDGDNLRIENEKKKLVRNFSSIKRFWQEDYSVFLTTLDGKTGIINSTTSEWEIKPVYPRVSVYTNGDYQTFWANYSSGILPRTGWFLTNQQGEVLTDTLFDIPFVKKTPSAFSFFKSEGKWGVIDKDLKKTVSARFDYKTTVYHNSFLVKDDSVFLVDPHTGNAFHLKYNFDETVYNGSMLLIDRSAIAVIDFTGKLLIPFTERAELEKTADLFQQLFPGRVQKNNAPYIKNNYIYYSGDSIAVRNMANRLILENALNNTVPLELVYNRSYDERQIKEHRNELIADSFQPHPNLFHGSIEPLFVNFHYYSEKRKKAGKKPLNGVNYEFASYQFLQNKAVELQLRDLFKPSSDYDTRLTSLLEEAIQQDQLFGLNCIDMPGIVQEFKRNFYITRGSLVFVHTTSGAKVSLHISKFGDLIANPTWFI
ncbi:MAG: RsiV family protein [Fluviicola sp.]|nr:RsiV family protein [Fluviicola sp.]